MKIVITLLLALSLAGNICRGTRADGQPCKARVAEGKNYCFNHDPTIPTCGFLKKDGTPCKRKVKDGGRCHNHK